MATEAQRHGGTEIGKHGKKAKAFDGEMNAEWIN
jgi:hypothetical protein